ncbi:MAG: hypothetical protein FWG66_02280 [Spirochaetes bacterium]|nr:hypothetical protein [Spirochaetota bacterium]
MEEFDYMNDPRMAEYKDEPLPVQEVRAWRLAEQDEKRNMTPEQRAAYYRDLREQTELFCSKHGIRLNYVDKKEAVTAP